MRRQHRNVRLARPQRRQLEAHHVETVVEIGAKIAGVRQGLEVGLAGGDDAAIHRDRLVAAESLHHPLLQHPQQLHLKLGRHVLDLVEKQRAATRELDLADAPLARTGKGARLMAEDLALEHALGQGRAVDCHELPVAAAGGMQCPGQDLLAGAGFAVDQHIGLGRADCRDHAPDLLDRRAVAEQEDRLLLQHLLLEAPVLEHQPAQTETAPHHVGEAVGGKRLLDEIVGALAHRLHRHRDATMAGHEDHRNLAVAPEHLGQAGQAVHARQAHVAHHHPTETGVELSQRSLRAIEAAGADSREVERLQHPAAHHRIVLDDEGLQCFSHPRCAPRQAAARPGTRRRTARCCPLRDDHRGSR